MLVRMNVYILLCALVCNLSILRIDASEEMSQKKSVLFVCLGNTCRSPIAEAVFLKAITEQGTRDDWEVDSAGIAPWTVGQLPEPRARAVMLKYDLPYDGKTRELTKEDFTRFDYIFGMDDGNIDDMNDYFRPTNATAKVFLLGEFDPEGERIIRDPIFNSGSVLFEKCYEQSVRSVGGFLKAVNSTEV